MPDKDNTTKPELLPCVVDGCDKSKKKSDSSYCSMHRARLSRTGRLDLITIEERLYKHSMPVPWSGCWIWIAYTNPEGYGRLRVDGKKVLAHRASYEEFNGVITDGLLVCHACDTPSCINPDHLFLGTNKDNFHDSLNKGRRDPVQQAKNRWKICPTLRKEA